VLACTDVCVCVCVCVCVVSIALRNLTHGMHAPSVLDLKVGTWYTSDRCSEDKMRVRQKEAAESTSGSVGLRLCGMRLTRSLEIMQANRYLGKVLQPVHLHRIVVEFFSPRPGTPHLPLIAAVVSHLEGIRGAVCAAPSLRLFSSSVLVVYDSHHALNDYAACPPFECKMIDFGQSQLEASKNDDGYVFGIESLLAILRGMAASAPAAGAAGAAGLDSSGAADDFDDA
jgi:hypothetical protein